MQYRYVHNFGPSRKPLRARIAPVFAAGVLGAALALPSFAAPTVPGHSAPAAQVYASASDVSINSVADITDVLSLLARQTHTNIVCGKDVQGTVTVSLSHVTLDGALKIICSLSGYQYAKVGGTYVVGTASSIAALTSGGSEAGQTAMIPFQYSNATDLVNIVKQLAPGATVSPGKAASGPGGVLIVTGSQADIDEASKVVSQAEDAIAKNAADSQTAVYNIKYVDATSLQQALLQVFPTLVVTPGPLSRQDGPGAMVMPNESFVDGTATTTQSTATASASSASTSTQPGANGSSSALTTPPKTASLLLTGSPAEVAKAEALLAQIDVRPAQIDYDAKVVDVNLDAVRNLGIKWDIGGSTSISESNTIPGKIASFGKFTRTPLSNLATVSLDALFTNGNAKILAAPNISGMDGQQAATFVGDTITYVSSVTQSATGQNITTATVNAGIKLLVTGKVNNDGYITLNLHPEVSTVTFQPSIGGSVLPDLSTREVTTTLRVRDGDTIAIGGLISDQDVVNIQKLPILGDIPFLGALFRDRQDNHQHRELMIFIKVSIQKDKPVA